MTEDGEYMPRATKNVSGNNRYTSRATKNVSGNKQAEKSTFSFIKTVKFIRRTLVYLLALYGLHSIAGNFSTDYEAFASRQIRKISGWVAGGARDVGKNLSPLPTITIKNASDAADSPYDNLTLGVPGGPCDVILDRCGYAIGYSNKYVQPLWVSYKLTADEVKSKKAKRSDDFRVDPAVPGIAATPEDYKGSFYDRGHLAPAADMSFSLQAMSESFYMSNMSPQRPEFNRGIWKTLESKVRDYALHNGAVYVVSGPIFEPGSPTITIGSNKISVPDKYYKVLLDPNARNPKAIGFIIENRDSNGKSLRQYAVSVDAVEAASGLDFFSELGYFDEKKLESQCDFNAWEQTLPSAKRSRD